MTGCHYVSESTDHLTQTTARAAPYHGRSQGCMFRVPPRGAGRGRAPGGSERGERNERRHNLPAHDLLVLNSLRNDTQRSDRAGRGGKSQRQGQHDLQMCTDRIYLTDWELIMIMLSVREYAPIVCLASVRGCSCHVMSPLGSPEECQQMFCSIPRPLHV